MSNHCAICDRNSIVSQRHPKRGWVTECEDCGWSKPEPSVWWHDGRTLIEPTTVAHRWTIAMHVELGHRAYVHLLGLPDRVRV